MKKKLYLLFLFCFSLPVLALEHKASGLGQVAANLMDPVGILTDFVLNGSLIAGVAFLFGAFVRFIKHRRNYLESPLSSVIALLVIGLILIGLPLTQKLL